MAKEPKTFNELVQDSILRAQVSAAASENPDYIEAKMTSGRADRKVRRDLNREDRSVRIGDAIAEAVERAEQLAALPESKRDLLGKPTKLSDSLKAKLEAEQKSHRESKKELHQALSQIKVLQGMVAKLEAKLASVNVKQAKKSSKVQATTAPEAGPNS